MGASLVYLDKPNKDIEIQEGANSYLKFAAGSMQGWRLNMVRRPLFIGLGRFPRGRVEVLGQGRLVSFWRV